MAKTSATLSVIPRGAGSPAAPSDDLVDAVQNFIEAKIAPLRERILVQQAEIVHLKSFDLPECRKAVDREIDRVCEAMALVKDGDPGPPGRDGVSLEDIDAVITPIKAQLAELAARPEPQPGRDGLPGVPGRDGAPGKDGADGLGFDDLQVTYDGQRKFTFRFIRGEKVKEFDITVPIAIYREVFKEGTAYVTGDQVSFGGSIWHCLEPTITKPGQGNPRWRLASKHGRDGRDGKSAYEIAVEKGGFKGSEQDWLKSLKGPPGKDGRGFTP